MKYKFLLLFFLIANLLKAQPAGYYNAAYGKTGEALREALYNIIKGQTVLSYTPGLWNAYYTTDVKPDGKLWDIYSDKPGGTASYEYTLGTNQCGSANQNNEGFCYNREHTWPQSKFNSASPMESDLWIAYPTDYYVNSKRGDYPYGVVSGTAITTFTNGTKIGNNGYSGAPTGVCFEPIDSFKGDIARTYFYITTRYLGDSASFIDWEMAAKSTLKPWAIQMLLAWHHLDPVSTKEKARNDAAFALQNNRNPFIDNPQFADCIWAGNCIGLSVPGMAARTSKIHCFPNPATNYISINWQELLPDEMLEVDLVNMQGQVLIHQNNFQNQQETIDLKNFSKGMYLLEMHTQQGFRADKVLVQ